LPFILSDFSERDFTLDFFQYFRIIDFNLNTNV